LRTNRIERIRTCTTFSDRLERRLHHPNQRRRRTIPTRGDFVLTTNAGIAGIVNRRAMMRSGETTVIKRALSDAQSAEVLSVSTACSRQPPGGLDIVRGVVSALISPVTCAASIRILLFGAIEGHAKTFRRLPIIGAHRTPGHRRPARGAGKSARTFACTPTAQRSVEGTSSSQWNRPAEIV